VSGSELVSFPVQESGVGNGSFLLGGPEPSSHRSGKDIAGPACSVCGALGMQLHSGPCTWYSPQSWGLCPHLVLFNR
jgi:hypothetical protein